MQMNNPLGIIKAIRNPQQFIQNMMGNQQVMQNPMIQNAMKMYQSGDVNGLKSLAENVIKEHGMSMDDIKKQLGI